MADRNDFKLLKQRCLRHFELAKDYLGDKKLDLDDNQKARYGFYFFVIQNLTNLVDYDKMVDAITDTEFNSTFFNINNVDEGIDAVCFDEQEHVIALFNFKYRNKYNDDKEQSKNELLVTSKFLNALKHEDTTHLKGKLKKYADKINEYNDSDDIWTTVLYYVSNESKTLSSLDPNIRQMSDTYGIDIEMKGLNELIDMTSLHPRNIDASLVLNRDAVMSFTETSLASARSYIVRLPLTELIRITCDDASLRNEYNLEDENVLYKTNVDIRVLFDNVRGFILQSKYNKNIETTLDSEPTKFFFYNNGITIVAERISSSEINSGKKVKLEISNFQVLNGGQTLRTIHNYNKKNKNNIVEKLSDAEVLVRMLNITDDALKGRIGEYTNSQDTLFANNDDLLSLKTVDLIKKYKCIYKVYRTANKTVTVQKAMYVLYISEKLKSDKYKQISTNFELYLKSYKNDNNVDKAESRILLDQKFKNDVEKFFGVSVDLNK